MPLVTLENRWSLDKIFLFALLAACGDSTAPPPVPAAIVVTLGQDQAALAGTVVPVAPVVQVRDQFNNGVPGVEVKFTVAEGGGSLSDSIRVTDASGNATVPAWRLGKSAVPQTLRATAGAFTVTISARIISDYGIDLRFVGPPMPTPASVAFTDAAARIRGSVTGDLQDINAGVGQDLTDCGLPGETLSGLIDDIVIYASVVTIDGPGRVLARAGPCFVRSDGRQTIVGVMQFDSADVQTLINQARLRDVIQHEMLHVVGIGTLWEEYSLLSGAGTPDPRYIGALGVAGCIAVGGASVCPGTVPVEGTGGAGTADSHWRESVFGDELMTGFVGPSNPFSVMSIQSLGDIGYVTNPNAADFYTIPVQSSSSVLGGYALLTPAWEEVKRPVFTMAREGRLSRIPRQ